MLGLRTAESLLINSPSQRLRLLLEIDREHRLAACLFKPLLEVGVRYDGGTGDSGIGAVLGLGLHYANAANWTIAGKVHALVGRKDYKEWGVQGAISRQTGADQRGLTFSLSPSYGSNDSGVNRVYQQKLPAGNGDNGDDSVRLNVNMGYGLFINGRLLVPYSEVGVGSSNHYRFGLRWTPNSPFNLHLYGERRESGGVASNRILLESRIRF